jgi:hypothetical protein
VARPDQSLTRTGGVLQEEHIPRRSGQVRLRPHYRDGVWYPGVALVVAVLAASGAVWAFAFSNTHTPPPTLSVQHVNGTITVPTATANGTTTTRNVVGKTITTSPPLRRSSTSSRTPIPSLLPGALLATLSRPPVATSPASASPLLAPILSTTTTTPPPTTTTRPPTTTTSRPSTSTTTVPTTTTVVPQTTTTTTIVPNAGSS